MFVSRVAFAKGAEVMTSEDLARLKIRRIVFHDIPNNIRGGNKKPVFSDELTAIDVERADMLKNRLTRALGSKAAYPVEFDADTSSPLPAIVQKCTDGTVGNPAFIAATRQAGQYLFDIHTGNISPGLLCVVDVASESNSGLAILKLEREKGAELEMKDLGGGHRTFEMSVLDNLVLTDGTRLFKSALFLNLGNDKFRITCCDSQAGVASSADVARFWMKFLGCAFTEAPRVRTQRWFDATIQFMNEYVTDAIEKNDLYEHVVSELKSNKKNVSPKQFIEDFMPDAYVKPYTAHLNKAGVSLHQFHKDTVDIASRLKRRAFHTAKGVTVTAPADQPELVQVKATQIVVQDKLSSVSNK